MESAHKFREEFEQFMYEMGNNMLSPDAQLSALEQFTRALRDIRAAYRPIPAPRAQAHIKGSVSGGGRVSGGGGASGGRGVDDVANTMKRAELVIGQHLYEAGSAHDVFMAMDIKGRNDLEQWELQHGMSTLGLSLTDEEAGYIIRKYGSQGKLSYAQFATMFEELTSRPTSVYDATYVGNNVVHSTTPRDAATFDWHTSEQERLEGVKRQVRNKIYQVYGSPSRAFLELDAADNSVLAIGELVQGLKLHGLNISREDAASIVAPFARAHKNRLTLTEFNKFCASGLRPSNGRAPAAATDRLGGGGDYSHRNQTNLAATAPPSSGRDLFRAAHVEGYGAGYRNASPQAAAAMRASAPGWRAAPAQPEKKAAEASVPSRAFSEAETRRLIQRVSEALYDHGNVRQMLKQWRSTKAGVSASDLKHGLHRIGTTITMDEGLALVQAYGGRDGRISLHEFMDMLSSVA